MDFEHQVLGDLDMVLSAFPNAQQAAETNLIPILFHKECNARIVRAAPIDRLQPFGAIRQVESLSMARNDDLVAAVPLDGKIVGEILQGKLAVFRIIYRYLVLLRAKPSVDT